MHPPGSGPFAKLLDVVVARADDAGVELTMDAGEEHLNANGIVHGGALMTLLDMAMATTVTRVLAPDERTASITINTDFLRAAKPGRLVATARLERRGRTAAFPVCDVRQEGELVARGTGVWAISKR